MSNQDHKKGPLTGGGAGKQRDKWYGYKGANEAAGGDAHFKQLSERFWGFARQVGFAGGERSLGDVLADMWRAKLYLALGAFAGCLLAGGLLFLAVPQTKVSMLVAPANPLNDAAAVDAGSPVMRFLAQQAGVDNARGFTQFENIYSGVSVAKILMDDPKIIKAVEVDRRYKFLSDRSDLSAEKLADYIARKVRLETAGVSSFRRLAYWHHYPAAAEYLVARIHTVTDQLIRSAVQRGAEERIVYLNAKIAETPHPDHRRALTELLLEQERLLMLASIDQPYAAAVIEPASRFYKAQWPNAPLWLFAFGVIGGFIGFVVYGLRRLNAAS